MIREKTHPCASVKSVFFDKSSPHGICVDLCDLWAKKNILLVP